MPSSSLKLHVEHHEIDARALERALHAAAAAGRGDAVAGSLQVAGERGARLAVFVDDENVFVCAVIAPSGAIATNAREGSIRTSGYVS